MSWCTSLGLSNCTHNKFANWSSKHQIISYFLPDHLHLLFPVMDVQPGDPATVKCWTALRALQAAACGVVQSHSSCAVRLSGCRFLETVIMMYSSDFAPALTGMGGALTKDLVWSTHTIWNLQANSDDCSNLLTNFGICLQHFCVLSQKLLV